MCCVLADDGDHHAVGKADDALAHAGDGSVAGANAVGTGSRGYVGLSVADDQEILLLTVFSGQYLHLAVYGEGVVTHHLPVQLNADGGSLSPQKQEKGGDGDHRKDPGDENEIVLEFTPTADGGGHGLVVGMHIRAWYDRSDRRD